MGEGLRIEYEPVDGVWQVTDVMAALYNREEVHYLDHERTTACAGAPVTGTTLTGTETQSSSDTWGYSLAFTEAKPLGTSASAWGYTRGNRGVRPGLGTSGTGADNRDESLIPNPGLTR